MEQTVTKTVRSHGLQNGRILYLQHTEWTPGAVTSDPSVRLPSTWKQGIGKVLTNCRIKVLQDKTALCLKCFGKSGVSIRKGRHLPKHGYYCHQCESDYKTEYDSAKVTRHEPVTTRRKREYV